MRIKSKIAYRRISVVDIGIALVLFIYFEPAFISYNFGDLNLIITFLKNMIFLVLLMREIIYLVKCPENRSSAFVYAVFLQTLHFGFLHA